MERKTPKARNVKVSDLKVNEEFAPKPDPVFNHLIVEATKGRLPVYLAVISMRRLKRRDITLCALRDYGRTLKGTRPA